jgi:2-aminoadipate transaminase
VTTIQFRQVVVAPGVIDLGVGQPDSTVFPLELFQRSSRVALDSVEQAEAEFFQYGAEYGDGHHRLALAEFLTGAYGVSVDPELLFSTNGNSQAIDMVCGVFTKPGDTIIVEEPTYFLARGIFADRHLNIVGVPMDGHGLDVDALAETFVRLRNEGTPARLVYTIPAFHNPTGVTLSEPRRQRLVELADEFDFLVVADEVYHLLGDLPKPMSAYVDSGRVLSLGTFSKILSPGLRLGWIHASPPLLKQLAGTGVVSSAGGFNPLVSALVTPLLAPEALGAHIAFLRQEYGRRIALVDVALRESMLDRVKWEVPHGGYFFWLTLPQHVDAGKVRLVAKNNGVDFRQGALFSSDAGLKNHIRLSFAYYRDDELIEGVRRLGHVLRLST